MKKTSTLTIVVAGLFVSASASGQATRLIEPTEPAYRDLAQLIDNGLAERVLLSQRPISRAVLARVVGEAERRLVQRKATMGRGAADSEAERARLLLLEELVSSLRERFEPGQDSAASPRLPRIDALRSVTIDGIRADAPTRLIPATNGLGGIDASLNPLLANREGRTPTSLASALLETTHSIETRHLAVDVTPQLALSSLGNGSSRANLRIQQLQLRLLFRNVAFDVGREYVVWGQGAAGGLLNSINSPPLDLVKVSNEESFLLPWVFNHLGPTRFALYYADLGADQNFPHAYAVAYRGASAPTNWLEIGASVYTKSGGRGAPRATATARLIDLLPFLDASAYNNVFGTRGNFQFSDHYAGVDGRLRLPSTGASLFWEVLLNDFDVRRLGSVLWEDAGHVVGAELPPLVASGRLRASLEYHHTGIRYYEHEQFLSGETLHHVLTGDPLGPNAQGAYTYFDWFASRQRRLGLQLAVERRSNDQYVFVPEPNYGFQRVEVRPKEWRSRAVLSWQLLPLGQRLGGLAQFGYERTRNFDFVADNNRSSFLVRMALQYRFE